MNEKNYRRNNDYEGYMAENYYKLPIDRYYQASEMNIPVKAVTIKQPYATLVCCGMADVANFAHKTNYRGLVLIHAAKSAPDASGVTAKQKKKYAVEILCNLSDYPCGAIIGIAELVDCVQNHPSKWAEKGKWNYVFRNGIFLKNSIRNVSGKSMIWDYSGKPITGEGIIFKGEPLAVKIMDNLRRKLSIASSQTKAKEEIFKEKVRRDTNLMINRLSKDEVIKISFLPIIITEMAWHFANLSMKTAATERIEHLKKISRTIKSSQIDYEKVVRKGLDSRHILDMKKNFNNLMEEISMDVVKLYYAVNGELKRTAPEYPYEEIRTYAVMAILCVNYLGEYNDWIDKTIEERLPESEIKRSVIPNTVQCMRQGMYAYAGLPEAYNINAQNIKTGMKVIANKLKMFNFELLES